MSEWTYIALILLFFLVAALYSSAGFGGGSSYLAILVMLPISFTTIRTTALICNMIVVSGSLFAFVSKGEFSRDLLRRILPLVLASIPLAFLAGKFPITERMFFTVLGIALIASAMAMFFSASKSEATVERKNGGSQAGNVLVGGVLGGLAGLVGIGGGIFLSPYLHLRRWDVARNISITTTFFIFVNSLSGLTGQVVNKTFEMDQVVVLPLALAVFLGGQIGVRVNIGHFSNSKIRQLTAVVILLAGINVIRKYWMI